MSGSSLKNNFIAVCVFCAVIFFDATAKKIVASYFVDRSLPGNFFVFGYFTNDKGLFGLISLVPVVFASAAIFIFFIYLLFRADTLEEKISLSLILGGGISNFCERLIFGRVTDIVAIGNFGVMNMADVAIFVGIVWYASLLVKKYS